PLAFPFRIKIIGRRGVIPESPPMSNLPCPNPSCKHSFTPVEVKGATSLKCPLCGTIFQFRSAPERGVSPARGGTTPPLPVAKPAASSRPAAAPPLALPPSPDPGPPAPVADTTFLVEAVPRSSRGGNDFVTDSVVSPVVQNRYRQSPQRTWTKLILACFFVVC